MLFGDDLILGVGDDIMLGTQENNGSGGVVGGGTDKGGRW